MVPHFSSFHWIHFFKRRTKRISRICSIVANRFILPTALLKVITFFMVKRRTMLLIHSFPCRDRLCPVLALFSELVCQSSYLPVLECYHPVIRYEQDPVIRNGLLTISCPDTQAVRLKADVGTAYG